MAVVPSQITVLNSALTTMKKTIDIAPDEIAIAIPPRYVELLEPQRVPKRCGLTAEQISEVQKRLSRLQPGSISSVKRIRENNRLLREQGITQANLTELFDYLCQTDAIE